MSRTALYRHYSADGQLLYVGITDCLSERNKQHAETSHWHDEVHKTEVSWCLSREHAMACETIAIWFEKPVHNVSQAGSGRNAKAEGQSTVRSFIASVGRSRFEAELGHTTQVVSRAIESGVMPAHWYFDCRDWCREIGVTVPEHLFRRKHRPRHKQGAEGAA